MRKLYKIFLLSMIFLVSVATAAKAQIANDKCKYLGNVIHSYVPTDFHTYWNQVTPENAGKWGSVEGTRDVMNWTGLDLAYQYAKSRDFPFKQHTFIWGNQQPSWIESLTAEEQLEEIEEWIQAYCTRYPDTDFIDVVNEPIHDPPSGATNGNYFGALGGTGTTGYDWVIKSFELARHYCPDAKLILNEYNIINDNNKTNQYITIINLLKERNLIDGIGVQGHRFELENATTTTLSNNLTKLGATGLPVHISEFDIGNLGNTGTPNDAQQLEIYQRVFPVLWNHPAVEGITLWGYKESEIWQQTAFLKRTNGVERSALTWLKSYVQSATGSNFCFPVTSVEEEGGPWSIYPNPSSGGSVFINSPQGNTSITISDSKGRHLKQLTVQGPDTIEVQLDLPEGLYIIRLEQSSRTVTKKLIVQ